MEIRSGGEEDDAVTRLFEAAMEGSVVTLNSLIQKDPLILSKISLTTFAETPLHVSALLGHLPFTKQLLGLEPKLASELDSLKRSPLHLASAKGHTEIVHALLQQSHLGHDMCLVKDEGGRIPLHYAAMRGHVDVLELLVGAQPMSVFEALPDGETVLHLCVQYNHLEALKVVVKSAGYDNVDFLNSKDHAGGNTVLHLAVMLKQIETIKYLLSIPGVKAGAENTFNNRGLKASELLEHFPRDFKTLQIQRILADADVVIKTSNQHHQQQHSDQLTISTPESTMTKPTTLIENKLASWLRKWIKHLEYKGDLTPETHNSLMVVATVIATMTFQTAVNPPGGVWQDNETSTKNPRFKCSERDICIAGTAVLAYSDQWRDELELFIAYNSTSFLASLAVILLLISGVPMGNKFGAWILTVAMCVALNFMAFTFLLGLILVMPDDIIDPVHSIYHISIYAWDVLLGLIVLFHSVRFLCWALIIKKFRPNGLVRIFSWLGKRFERKLGN